MPFESLCTIQRRQGGVFPDEGTRTDGGPLYFGDAAAEHRAAVESAALFDLSGRARIEVTGDERASFLHNFCTNDVNSLSPGRGCEAFATDVKGRILGHLFVSAGDDALWIDSVPGSEAFLIEHLEKYVITEDVFLRNRTGDFGSLLLVGPQSAEFLRSGVGVETAELDMFSHAHAAFDGNALVVTRVPFTQPPACLITIETALTARIWEELTACGVRPSGSAVFEPLRIEAGMPVYGKDLTAENLVQEASRTASAVSFTKGCYLGQEPIARLDALGHVNRELRGLQIDSTEAPAVGASVFGEADGDSVGRITSSAVSFSTGGAVALGMLSSGSASPDTSVRVEQDGKAPARARVFWI